MLNRRIHFMRKWKCITANSLLLTKVIYALELIVGTDEYDMTSGIYRRRRKNTKENMKRLRELYYKFMKRFSHSLVDRVEHCNPIQIFCFIQAFCKAISALESSKNVNRSNLIVLNQITKVMHAHFKMLCLSCNTHVVSHFNSSGVIDTQYQ